MTSNPMTSLGEDYPLEQARCRRLITQYCEIQAEFGGNVTFAVAMIEDVLARADRAVMSDDVLDMIASYQEMQGCQ